MIEDKDLLKSATTGTITERCEMNINNIRCANIAVEEFEATIEGKGVFVSNLCKGHIEYLVKMYYQTQSYRVYNMINNREIIGVWR